MKGSVALVPITLDEIQSWVKDAKRAGLCFSPSTRLYAAYATDTGHLIGFCGMAVYGRKVKMKNDYVLPEHRRKGYGRGMLKARLLMARNRGIGVAEATCTRMSRDLYLSEGATVVREYEAGGFTMVRMPT